MNDYTKTPNYSLYKPTPNADDDVWGDHLNANADTLDGLLKRIDQRGDGSNTILVSDYLPLGQPDGITDVAPYLQDAIDAAAGADPANRAAAPGFAQLVIQASLAPYIVGASLIIPSNSHIVIAQGATLKLAPQTNANMFLLVCFAHHVLIELYGTLDGNSSQQFFEPNPAYPATSVHPTTISGGISNDTIQGLQGTIQIQGGICSHIRITGDRNGLITNFQNGTVGLSGATNAETSGISMTNSAFRAGSVGVSGWRNFPFDPVGGGLVTFTGTYVAATNLVTLTTNVPHRMVPGEEFITEGVTGSSGTYNCATGKLFITLPGTTGNTIVYNGTGGGSDAVITGGRITNWFYQQANIAGGTYVPATGIITVTTTAPHQLVYGQMISSNITGGTAAIATGIFQLLDVTNGASEPPIPAAKNVTLRYRATRSGTTVNVVSGSYDAPSGLVTLITDVALGVAPNDVVTIGVSGSGFRSAINAEQLCTTGTLGTTICYAAPPNLTGTHTPVITGGTVTGGPTQTITGGTIGVSTKVWNSGFDNCFMDQIRDIGPCIYGGGVNCYIRHCEVTRNIGSGPYLFSDQNSGRCVDCEISGNYIHDNYGAGVGTVNFGSGSPPHIGTRIFGNYITGNYGAAGFGSCDGLDFFNNRLYANRVQGLNTYGSVGEIVVGPHADRVKIVGNSLRDPCVLSTSLLGSGVLQVASGTYDNVTGAVVLTMVPPLRAGDALFTSAYFTLSNTTGTGANTSIEGRYIVEQAPANTIKFHAPAGLGASTITGGQVTPNGFGIMVHFANQLLVADNFIGDYQATKTMLACIGGTWGAGGVCAGNYYGPRINTGAPGTNFPADMSSGAKDGQNFDTVTGFTDGTTLRQPFSNDVNERFPPLGIAVGYNRSGGRGESNIFVGAANASPGGFEFVKVIGLALSTTTPGYVSTVATVASSGNTYDNVAGTVVLTTTASHGMAVGNLIGLSNVTGTVVSPDGTTGTVADFNGAYLLTAVTGTTLTFIGPPNEGTVTITGGTVGTAIVTLATTTPHGLVVGSRFGLSLVLGKTAAFGDHTNLGDIGKLTGAWIATGDNAGTSGTTINFNLTTSVAGLPTPYTGLDILAIEAGAINASEMDSGVIDASVGLPTGAITGGSLFAVDGYANTRLSGALVHGAIQAQTLVNAGTITVPQNTSFMLVNNSSSIATGSLVLPAPAASSFQTIGAQLDVRFQNPVGALTVTAATGAAVAGPPTTVLSAGAAFRFIQGGPGGAANTWLPCIPDVSGTPPVGGPYLPVSGGAVTGALTVNGMSTHTAGLTVSGGGSVAGTFSGAPTWSGAHTFNGTTTHGSGSANYWTVAGSSGSPAISVAGSGNLFATIQGLGTFGTLLRSGNGTNLRTQDTGVAVGNFLLLTAAAAGNPVALTANDNTGGISFGSPLSSNYGFTYSGLVSNAANKPFNFINTINGTSANTAQYPISQFLTTYNNFKSGQGAYGFKVETDIASGSMIRGNVAIRAAATQTAQPGILAAWAASTAYTVGILVSNTGNLYQCTTAGTSAASGGPTGGGSSITDGTVVWMYCDAANAVQTQVALGVLATCNYNVGGVAGAAVGNNWGSVIGAGLQSAATFYNENIGLEIDHFNNAGTSVNRSATVQLVRSGTVQGTYQDWGISFSAAGAKWINPILFQSAVDPNGYAISFQDQNAGALQTMAAVLDMRMVTPTGTGPCGGNFFAAWPNGSLGSSGNLNIDYTTLKPGANGLIIDVSLLKCTAASIVSGGTNWVSGMWAADQNGNFVTVTASSGVVTAATLQIAGYAATAPTGAQTFTALTPSAGLLGPTGSAVRATPFTATLTYAAVSNPTLVLQSTTGGRLTMPALQASTTYANDAAAATGGVSIGQLYRNGSAVQIRVS